MDCNQVFNLLTGAPFPTGSTIDIDVECHLQDCASCRRFAEAMRPDEQLLHEQLPLTERLTLPRYRTADRPVMANRADSPRHVRDQAGFRRSTPESSGGWQAAFEHDPRYPQVAAFALAPRQRGNWISDAASLIAVTLAVALGGLGLGWLAL